MPGVSHADFLKSSISPSFTAASPRIFSRSSSISGRAFKSSGSSRPVNPMSFALTNTRGLAASMIDTLTAPKSGTSKTSITLPVGNNPLPKVPAGFKNFSFTGAAVPGTPAIAKSPEYSTTPLGVLTSASIIFFVLVLKIFTLVIPSCAFTRPFSIANGPTPDEIFPQLPL